MLGCQPPVLEVPLGFPWTVTMGATLVTLGEQAMGSLITQLPMEPSWAAVEQQNKHARTFCLHVFPFWNYQASLEHSLSMWSCRKAVPLTLEQLAAIGSGFRRIWGEQPWSRRSTSSPSSVPAVGQWAPPTHAMETDGGRQGCSSQKWKMPQTFVNWVLGMTFNGCLKGLILTHCHQENTGGKGMGSNPDCLGLDPYQLCDHGQFI